MYGDWFTLSEVVDEQMTRLRRSCHHSGFHGGPFSGVDVTLTGLYSQHWLGLNVNTTNKVRHTCSVGEMFFGIRDEQRYTSTLYIVVIFNITFPIKTLLPANYVCLFVRV